MVSDIRLQQFRSYNDETFEFGPGVNIIVGPNASGKTNLLESVLVAATGTSYRANDKELVKIGKSWTRLVAHSDDSERIVKIELTPGTTRKTLEINRRKFTRLPKNQIIPCVVFEPEHLQLVSSGPELRRDFLDTILEQTKPGYRTLRQSYKRTLSQRNRLLKQGPATGRAQLFAWNIRLSELAEQIAILRDELVSAFNKQINELYKQISSSNKKTALTYQTTSSLKNYSSKMLRQLEQSEAKDFLRGFTTFGPHREDMFIELDGQPAQLTASRGENRTLTLALKILELKLIEEVHGQKPLLLLDDVFSELDGARRRALTKFLKNYQTFITTTDADIVVKHFMGKCTIIPTTKK